MRNARGVWFWPAVIALFAVPAAHPMLDPVVGGPSHLLWWIHVLPVAILTHRYGARPAGLALAGSVLLLVASERLFGAVGDPAADWHTVGALAAALGFTNALVAGFALYARRAELQLRHNAFYDVLTGLPNRALLLNRLERALEPAEGSPPAFALLFLDMDEFKLVNDSLGHAAGDRLLVEVGSRLRRAVRGTDTVARIGGDEFVILLDGVADRSQVTRATERLQRTVSEPVDVGPHVVTSTASVGIALATMGRRAPDELLRDANIAMYRAKSRGRGQFEVFDTRMHAEIVARMDLERELRTAIDAGAIYPAYQPIVDLASGRIIGFEALARWQRQGEDVPPSVFIPLAEHSGLIARLGQHIMTTACAEVKARMQRTGEVLTLAVNVAVAQFGEPGLLPSVRDILRATGYPPHLLVLEITETSLLRIEGATIRLLEDLRGSGVRVAIDDFGTGYSSLSYVQGLPVDALKIDRSFVARLDPGPRSRAIVQAILALASSFNLLTVAEGIEHDEQRRSLLELGCTRGQGFYFGPPLPLAEFAGISHLPNRVVPTPVLASAPLPERPLRRTERSRSSIRVVSTT